MKDIVDNRRRLALTSKVRLASIALRDNGPLWLTWMGIYYLASYLADFCFRSADRRRSQQGLPGLNGLSANKLIWENWDWSAGGDEWTPNQAWKESVSKTFIDRYYAGRDTILEIGPGAGRWTGFLIGKANRLVGVDISSACVEECRKRFAGFNASFEIGNGRDLSMLAAESIDAIWSFDVFVHINNDEFRSYVSEFRRILKPSGIAIIHHGSSGGSKGGWRSNATTDSVRQFMVDQGLLVKEQIKSWTDDGAEHFAGLYDDVITIAMRPPVSQEHPASLLSP
jgi:SAM-dependent methyltransferase